MESVLKKLNFKIKLANCYILCLYEKKKFRVDLATTVLDELRKVSLLDLMRFIAPTYWICNFPLFTKVYKNALSVQKKI